MVVQEDREYQHNSVEFALINPRNIEVKKFSGEIGSKMTYLELNDGQRELTSIKGKDGMVLNKILIWAERQGDATLSNTQLEKLETIAPKYGNTIGLYTRHLRIGQRGMPNDWSNMG